MKLLIILIGLSLKLAISSPTDLGVAFLGVTSEQEPWIKTELVRQIFRELRTLNGYDLVPMEQIDFLYKKGTIKTAEVGSKKAISLAKSVNSRIIVYGTLKRLNMDYERAWYMPFMGRLVFHHSMWLKVIDGKNGEVRFSGLIEGEHKTALQLIGAKPRIGELEAIYRQSQLNMVVRDLAANTKNTILASIKGIEQELIMDYAAKPPAEVVEEGQEPAPVKEKTYDPSLFKPKKKVEKPAPVKKDTRLLTEEELKSIDQESIKETEDLLEKGLFQ